MRICLTFIIGVLIGILSSEQAIGATTTQPAATTSQTTTPSSQPVAPPPSLPQQKVAPKLTPQQMARNIVMFKTAWLRTCRQVCTRCKSGSEGKSCTDFCSKWCDTGCLTPTLQPKTPGKEGKQK